mgnify:CR=1 FL=1
MLEKIENPFLDFPNYRCFACSPENPIGFRLNFYKSKEQIISYYTPEDNYSGLPKVMHGGLACVLLDEIMFWAIFIFHNKITFTTNINLKYKKYIPTNEKITLKGKVSEAKKKLFKACGELCDENDETLCSSEGIYFSADISTLEKVFKSGSFPEKFKKYCR